MQIDRYDGPADAWDRLVRRSEDWTHFHLYGWRSVIERTFGHECVYLAARDGGGLAGVLPLVRVKSIPFGHFLVSMPFLNYGGPLGSREAVRALAADAVRRAAEDGVGLLELRSRGPLDIELPVSHRKITVVLPLPDQPDVLWEALESKVRSQVRRPRKEGIEVRFGADQVLPFHSVFSRHMRDLGTPAMPSGWFRQIWETFGSDVWFGCAYLDGVPIAGGCGLRWDAEVEMTWASSLREYSRSAPNMLLYWAFMERAIREGLERFNFGRCSPDGGTHRFKAQWGGEDEQLWWYHRSSEGGPACTPSADDEAFAWGPRLWRKLPLPVSRAFGPWIVRYLP